MKLFCFSLFKTQEQIRLIEAEIENERLRTLNKCWEIYVCRKWRVLLACHCKPNAERERVFRLQKWPININRENWFLCQLISIRVRVAGRCAAHICIETYLFLKKYNCNSAWAACSQFSFHSFYVHPSHLFFFPSFFFRFGAVCCCFSVFSSIYALAIISIKLHHSQRAHIN